MSTRSGERIGRLGCLCALWTIVCAGRAWSQELPCEVWAVAAESSELVAVEAVCGPLRAAADHGMLDEQALALSGDVRVEAPEGSLTAAHVVIDATGLRAEAGCLELGAALGCCGAEVERTADGQWSMMSPVCDASGSRVEADRLVARPGAPVGFEGLRSPGPLGLPLAGSDLDAAGRSAGIAAPTLGYRSDRGLGGRLDGFVPLGPSVDWQIGAFGETSGAAGLATALRWFDGGTRRLAFFGARDPVVETELRGAASADAALLLPQVAGLAVHGSILTDATVDRDFSWDPVLRARPDRHLSATLWTGGSSQRLWFGTATREIGLAAGLEDEDSPAADHFGSLPAAGWVASHAAAGLGQLSGALRFDRSVASPQEEPLNQLRLVAGGTLHALQIPVLGVFPGAWLVTDIRFSDPASTEVLFRDFRTELWTTLELSSPWVGGGPDTWHLVALRARGAFRAVENRDRDGTPPAASPAAPDEAPLQLDVGLDQEIVSGSTRVSFPVRWLARVDKGLEASRIVARSRLRTGVGRWRLGLGQLADFDLDAAHFCCWMGDAAIAFLLDAGATADALPEQRQLEIAGSWTWHHSGSSSSSALAVPTSPLLRDGGISATTAGAIAAGARLELDLTGWGLSARATWLGEDYDRPALDGGLRVGHARGLRLTLYGGVHPDDVAIVQLSLTFHQGAWGPWALP